MSLSFWGLALTCLAYALASLLYRRFSLAVFQPILIASVLVMGFLTAANIPHEEYSQAVQPLTKLLLPATVCLAIPVYKRLQLLRPYLLPVLAGIMAGTLISMSCVALAAKAFGLDSDLFVSFLPKSVTTAFGMELAAEHGGIPALAAAVIILTGIVGNMTCVAVCKVFAVTHPVAVGVCVGVSSHAIGTAKALSLGETEGAMASLAMVLTGLLTTALMPLFLLWA